MKRKAVQRHTKGGKRTFGRRSEKSLRSQEAFWGVKESTNNLVGGREIEPSECGPTFHLVLCSKVRGSGDANRRGRMRRGWETGWMKVATGCSSQRTGEEKGVKGRRTSCEQVSERYTGLQAEGHPASVASHKNERIGGTRLSAKGRVSIKGKLGAATRKRKERKTKKTKKKRKKKNKKEGKQGPE